MKIVKIGDEKICEKGFTNSGKFCIMLRVVSDKQLLYVSVAQLDRATAF